MLVIVVGRLDVCLWRCGKLAKPEAASRMDCGAGTSLGQEVGRLDVGLRRCGKLAKPEAAPGWTVGQGISREGKC